MKAIRVERFGGVDELRMVDLQQPVPGDEDVLVQVEAVGVNPLDTYIRRGEYPVLPDLPYIPGRDMAGTIIAVGGEVTKWKQGDRVYCVDSISGCYAEFVTCHQMQIFSLPHNMSFSQGAAVGVSGAAAWRALFVRARAKKGESLLIHGASGAVGLLALQLAVGAGLQVFGTAGTEAGLDLVRGLGATKVYNHNNPGYVEEISRDMSSSGFDIVLEMLADKNLVRDLDLLGTGGRVVIVGSQGTITLNPRATMAKETEILGLSLLNCSPEQMGEAQIGLYQEMVMGRLVPQVGVELPLKEVASAHRRVLGSGNCGKIILLPNP